MNILRRHPRISATILSLAAALSFTVCHAQSFPSRPIVLIYPYAPGSSQQSNFRAVLTEASKLLGQQYLIENKPGANQRLGINAIRDAKPDGYVTTLGSDANLVHQPMEDPAYKLEIHKDYTPIIFISRTEFVVVAHPSVPFRDIKGLIAYGRQNPKKLNWAGAPGSTSTLTSLKIQKTAGFEATMIPYKGAGETAAALMGGQVDVFTSTPGVFKQYIDQGKVIALAVSGKQRSPVLSGVPTLTEAGLPMPPMATWFGIISSPGIPADVVSKLYQALHAGLKSPETARLMAAGAYATDTTMTTNDYAEFIKAEINTWK